ncbi:CBS domain-containing protein [Actinomadura barringtoniae]|uniref:CBS domain-containing protein n=1 Tax=Actinomadura barringtoniae TaxID=1427535 RepID=A0A939T4K4_9ACTN|nr:CBS domain-containing protein [Actinomadura barringtoniae]MBO2446017.1 CBS domain-containing protein [Actinomadura barringtoniae]
MDTKVEAVMTTDVAIVPEHMPFRQIVNVLRRHAVNAAPVVREDGTVSGVVSTTDLLLKEADPTAAGDPHPFAGPRRRSEVRKSAGTEAADLMTAPAVTVAPDATVEEAARIMRRKHISRLPVVDAKGRLVGIVSRTDVLRVYDRPDEEIREDVLKEVQSQFALDRYAVRVDNGRVSIEGAVDRRSVIPALLYRIRRVEGVVSAEAQMTWEVDDTYGEHYPTL